MAAFPLGALPTTSRTILLLCLTLRLINSLAITTFFQPDEYFQSLEPAWHAAFGPTSGAWMTWEWKYYLRSSLHPVLFAAVYRTVDLFFTPLPLPALRRTAIIAAPKILQAIFAALGDFSTWKLSCRAYGRQSTVAKATLFMMLLNPWQWYCSVRTFSNSLEMTITVAALSLWPWSLLVTPANPTSTLPAAKPLSAIKENPRGPIRALSRSQLRLSLFLAAIAVLLRPTNLLIWLAVLSSTVAASPTPGTLITLGIEAVILGSLALGLSVASDRFFFANWVFPPFQWLYFNLNQDLAVFYGRNDVTYYLSQGLPLLTTTQLPFALHGLYQATKGHLGPVARTLSYTVYATCAILTLVAHKEVRFIYPLLPALTIIAAPSFSTFLSTSFSPSAPLHSSRFIRSGKSLLIGALFVNFLIAGYLGTLHQRAAISVLHFLRNSYTEQYPHAPVASASTPSELYIPNTEQFVLFLMPCHTTPWRSHLVFPTMNARALTCEPPLHTAPRTAERKNYRSENDRFYDEPIKFLREEVWPEGAEVVVPKYITGFQGIEAWLREFIESEDGKRVDIELKEVWRGWNGLFNEDWRRRGDIVVWATGH